jgi:L-asparagine transporter-like permease
MIFRLLSGLPYSWLSSSVSSFSVFVATVKVNSSLSLAVLSVADVHLVEFVLSIIKIAACIGFIILGIVINTGGVGNKGYLGAKYWHDPGAFQNGFNGFAGVFVVAAFSFAGTELVGLAAAESANPRKSIPLAAKQVFFRIFFFYIVNLFILGLILPATDPRLENASGSNSRFSPFVLAIKDAGIQALPSIFNVVITLSVISVANSCAFGSTRTMQALAERGMAPKLLSYVDKKGRPLWCVVVQLVFGLLGFVADAPKGGTAFGWLLAISGLANLLVWGSCCLAHIRFRMAWKSQGRDLREIPYRAPLGIWGSAIGFFLVWVCLIATFYNALYVRLSSPLYKASMQTNTHNPADAQFPTRGRGVLPELPGRFRCHWPVRVLEGVRPPIQAVCRSPGYRSSIRLSPAGPLGIRRSRHKEGQLGHAHYPLSLLNWCESIENHFVQSTTHNKDTNHNICIHGERSGSICSCQACGLYIYIYIYIYIPRLSALIYPTPLIDDFETICLTLAVHCVLDCVLDLP